MTELEIALLGGLRLRHPDRGPIELAGEKGPQLLARLACPPGTKHRRDTLQALLWPDSDPPHAQGNLRFVLHQLRKVLGGSEGPLRSDSRSVWLDPDRVAVDAVRFEALAAEGTLEALTAACDLYRGDLLSDVADLSPEYEDWLLPERERLRDLARSAFWNLFSLRLWRGEVTEARACAQRYLGIDPYCERMHAALMRLHLTQGERALAAGRYGEFRARLARDLQIQPGAKVEQLARAVTQVRGGPTREPFNAAWVLGRSDVPSEGKPLVAVLPFRDLSEDRTLVSLPAALTEDVIADLARFRRLGVLARHTSFALGRDPDPETRVRQLGARYTVEGSVRRTGNRLSVTARLVDNTSQRQVWGEHYQGDWEELPSFQEEAAMAIVATIPVQVEQAELERIRHREIQSLSAYEHCLRGREHQRSIAHASHAKALEHFSRALEQDPTSAAAHCGLAVCYVSTGGITPGEEDRRRERAISHAQQAIALDPLDPQGYWLLGMLLQMRRDFSGARFHLDRAVTLSPGDVETLGYTGLEYAYAGEPERGIGQAEQAIRLNPYFPPVSAEQIGKACFIGRRYEEALFWLRQTPDRITTNRGWLAAAAAYAGRLDEAAMHALRMRATLQQRLGKRSCGQSAARSGGSGYRPGFSMRPTWSTTSAVWPWPASNRDFGDASCETAPEKIEPSCLYENPSAGSSSRCIIPVLTRDPIGSSGRTAQEDAMRTNVELIQMLYEAFRDGRIDTILEHCSDTITWDCVGNPDWVPLAGTRSGKAAVQRFFEDLARGYTFEEFAPQSFHDAGDHVFCFGHERAIASATGQTIDIRFLHAFRIDGGKVAAFTQFSDTAAVAVGSGTLRVAEKKTKAA